MESPILDIEGNPIEESNRTIVLRDLCINALLRDEKDSTPKDKLDRFLLAMLIKAKRRPKLRSEDVTLIKDRIAAIYPPLLVGRAYELLDPAAVKYLGEEGVD
jgi:hypothetical protein